MLKLKLKADADGLRIREAPVNGKPVGQLHLGQIIESQEDDATTQAKVGKEGEWLKIKTPDGIVAYTAAWMLDYETPPVKATETTPKPAPTETPTEAPTTPTPATARTTAESSASPAMPEGIPLHPTIKALKIRAKPVDGDQVGLLSDRDVVFSMEDNATTESKLGVKDQWLKIKTLYKQEAYTAAWFLEKHTGEIPKVVTVDEILKGLRNITGMNLDIHHPLGSPDPARLQGMGWVRFLFNVSYDPTKQGDARYGNQDVNATFERYKPHLEKYANAGYKVLLVFTHQTYGEGRNEFWPWQNMTTSKWQKLTDKFVVMVREIATKFKGTNLVHAYQVWNEMDAPIGAVASVPLVSGDYAILLGATIKAIKEVDPSALVITGGHTSGPAKGSQFARDTLNALPAGIQPDGIAFHPYGRGVVSKPTEPYSIFGSIDEEISSYSAVLPTKPLWMTEWGVLDRPGDNSAHILQYASEMVNHMKTNYSGKIAAMMWYAWAMGMHNGYGLVRENDQAIQPFNDGFRNL